MNPEIAEILGAFIGDGWIESGGKALYITGDKIEDKDYYDFFISRIFSKNFVKVKPKHFPYWNVYGICTYKKYIIKKALNLGFQEGKKCLTAKIPISFFNSKNQEVIKALLRGLFDTDGSFWCEKSNAPTSTKWKRTHRYIPQIGISSCSEFLLSQVQDLLLRLGISSKIRSKNKKGRKNNRNLNNSFSLKIRNKNDIENWFNLIGTNNSRHKIRYITWKKLGYLPLQTNLSYKKN